MGVWTKKRGSMKAVVFMATPCPKPLISKAPDILHNRTGTHTHSITHGQMPRSRYSRRLHSESWALRVTRGRTGPSLYRE